MNKLILFLIGIVLLGIAGFALLWFTVGGQVEAQAGKLLVDLRDGKFAEVHDAAHPAFQEAWTPALLEAWWKHWEGELGGFGVINRRRRVAASTGTHGSRKSVVLDLAFVKERAFGEFLYIEGEPEPKLRHLSLWLPTEQSQTDRSGFEATVDKLFQRWDANDIVGLYAQLAPALQMEWPLRKMDGELPALRKAFGKRKALRLVSAEDGEHETVKQTWEVDFENTEGSARVIHQWLDDHARWAVSGFFVNAKR